MKEVYFTKQITAESLVKVFNAVGRELPGKVAIKISTGEAGNPNYLKPELIKALVKKLNGTITECNTAYPGKRNTTEDHLQTAREHGFFEIADVDIMDSEGDMELPVQNGKHLSVNYVGSHLANYDSILMLSHFKGHPMGGFGGALKNMSIGVASSKGKSWIHSAGKITNPEILWDNIAVQDDFLESMAEADKSVVDYIGDNIVYINVINNLSVDCDCVANPESVCMSDIGVVASADPVAIDQACLDLIYKSEDFGKKILIERIERQNGQHLVDYADQMGVGTTEYILKIID